MSPSNVYYQKAPTAFQLKQMAKRVMEDKASQERAIYVAENKRPYRPYAPDLAWYEIVWICEFELGKDWSEYFYGEFPAALYPRHYGGFAYMANLKYELNWTTWELLNEGIYGFFINVCGAHPRINRLVDYMHVYNDDPTQRPKRYKITDKWDEIAWDELPPEIQQKAWDEYWSMDDND